jgi:hypothetical protein
MTGKLYTFLYAGLCLSREYLERIDRQGSQPHNRTETKILD